MGRDFYGLLGVSLDATDFQIRMAHAALLGRIEAGELPSTMRPAIDEAYAAIHGAAHRRSAQTARTAVAVPLTPEFLAGITRAPSAEATPSGQSAAAGMPATLPRRTLRSRQLLQPLAAGAAVVVVTLVAGGILSLTVARSHTAAPAVAHHAAPVIRVQRPAPPTEASTAAAARPLLAPVEAAAAASNPDSVAAPEPATAETAERPEAGSTERTTTSSAATITPAPAAVAQAAPAPARQAAVPAGRAAVLTDEAPARRTALQPADSPAPAEQTALQPAGPPAEASVAAPPAGDLAPARAPAPAPLVASSPFSGAGVTTHVLGRYCRDATGGEVFIPAGASLENLACSR